MKSDARLPSTDALAHIYCTHALRKAISILTNHTVSLLCKSQDLLLSIVGFINNL